MNTPQMKNQIESLLSRRTALKSAACGFGYMALQALASSVAAEERGNLSSPLAPQAGHFRPRAKRVIFLYMAGGPSHMDTFDYKPLLQRDHGKEMPGGVPALQKAVGRKLGMLLKSPFKFAQHGESGLWASELFPNVAKHIDDLCIIRSMHTRGFDHANATLVLNTGTSTFIRPSMGSWVTYGLGSENQSLPGFMTICPSRTRGNRNHSSGFLPSIYQGSVLGHDGVPTSEATIRHLRNAHLSKQAQQGQLDFIRQLNQRQPVVHPELEGMIQSFELGYRMQQEAPDVLDISNEPQHIKDMYGVDETETDDFGRQCLMARRLSEAGVRFVQLTHTIRRRHEKIADWDQHSYLEEGLRKNCFAVDQPIAALLTDLKQRGLLEDTLVLWGGEFGRTPVIEYRGASSGRGKRRDKPAWN